MPPAGYPAFLQYLQSGRVRNLAIGPNGASCRWRDLRVTLQAHQVGIPGRYRSLAVTEGMPQPVRRYPKGALALVLGGEEESARCQIRDPQVAATDPRATASLFPEFSEVFYSY